MEERRENENERKKREFPKVLDEFVNQDFLESKIEIFLFLKEGWICILRDLL